MTTTETPAPVANMPRIGDAAPAFTAMDPQIMVQVADQPGLREVAHDANAKLHTAIDALSQTAQAN